MYTFKNFSGSSHLIIGDLVNHLRPQTILELACNQGFLGRSLNYLPSLFYGIDQLPIRIRSKYTRIFQKNLDITDLSFLNPQKFDLVVAADILEHLKSPRREFRLIKKLLAPAGRLLICLPNSDFLPVRFLISIGIYPRMSKGPFDRTHLHYFSHRQAMSLISQSGFTAARIIPVPPPFPFINYFWSLAKRWPRHFAYQLIFITGPASD